VRLPHCGYRADVAVYKPGRERRVVESEGKRSWRMEAALGTTAVFECKQARADLLRDSFLTAETQRELKKLHERKQTLERLLRVHLPSALNGDSLFQEFRTLNAETLNHRGYRRVLRGIAALQKGLFKTKFEKLVRYRCANLFYLVAAEGICAEHELPPGWGLLVKKGDVLQLLTKPVWHDAREGARLELLHRLAAKTAGAGKSIPLSKVISVCDR
jgi:hypothetical protein